MKTLKEIMYKYAQLRGGGLPLTAEEVSDCVVKWVQQFVEEQASGVIPNLDEYVKFTDVWRAGNSKAGLIKTSKSFGMRVIDNKGLIAIQQAEKEVIDAKSSVYQPIVPNMLDYAVKVGITTNTETWTDEDKASACETIGAVNKKYVDALIAELRAEIASLKGK